jgi:proline iminopeptidase
MPPLFQHITVPVVPPAPPRRSSSGRTSRYGAQRGAGPRRGVAFTTVWNQRTRAVAVVVGAMASGWLVARTLPRGPVTASQAVSLMLAGLAVGLVAGLVLRSRWAMVLAPLVHVAAFEVARIGAFGPTVGAIRLDSVYGIIALIVGRGFYGLVCLAPMILGASIGARVTRLATAAEAPSWFRRLARWGWTALASLGFLGLAGLIVLPATTPLIRGADGRPLPAASPS